MKNIGDTIKRDSDDKLFKVIGERNGHKLLMDEDLEVTRLTRGVVSMYYTATDEPFEAEGEWQLIDDFTCECASRGMDDGTILKLLNVMRAMVMR